jgi:hypothetical protein
MLYSEISRDISSGPVSLSPRWLRIPAATKYSGLSRARLYELLGERRIKSICLKAHKNVTRGIRLVDRESIDQFMLELAAETEQQTVTQQPSAPKGVTFFR